MNQENILSDSEYNYLQWKSIREEDIPSRISGLTVCGAELIDYPVTSGIVLYLKDKSNRMTILSIEHDEHSKEKYLYFLLAMNE